DGKAGVKILLKKVLIWRVHWFWYIFILFMPIILYGSAVWFSTLIGFQLDSAHPEDGFKAFFYLILLALPFGPMGEELGWRGYMLPKLLKKMDIWRSSLLLGFVWTLWHLASFTFPGAAIPSVFEVNVWTIFLYFLYICAETLLLTYVYLKTKGSVLIAILFHASLNACSNFLLTIFPDIEHNLPHREIIYIVNFLLLAVVAGVLLCSNRGDTKHNFQNNA
ncbi:MAG: CPBP family intramembrane metalloprotease, partial [Deferribacteres bacterium]|nr:CPBP family intramembrane metalloprotease [Deferribacteres bacterium]